MEGKSLTISATDVLPEVIVELSAINEVERRLQEFRVVNCATFNDLSFIVNEGYREAKTNVAELGFHIVKTERKIQDIKSQLLLDEYPEFRKERKLGDNAANRDAYLNRNAEYRKTLDRLDQLNALLAHQEGKVRLTEKIYKYIDKQINIELRSGAVDTNKYVR